MKKILMTFILGLSTIVSSAQITTENSRTFDNVGIGITGGATTPLDFNSIFPLNANVGLKVQKDVTPYLGFQVEGLTIFNDNHFTNVKTAFKVTNIGLNSVFNLTNILFRYKEGRKFEISAIGGLGWFREFDTTYNSLTSKTGLDLAYNIGNSQLVLTPAIYWDLNRTGKIQFNKNNAQLGLNLSYVYFFNKGFKRYDVGAMLDEISYLSGELSKKPTEVEVYKYVDRIDTVYVKNSWLVQFAKNSYDLTDEAKEILDTVDGVVKVVATSSPEGTAEYNQILSERRAATIADYLTKRGVKVNYFEGKGTQSESSNRIAVISRD